MILFCIRPGQNFLSMDGYGRMDSMRRAPGQFCAGWITQKWHRFHRKRVRLDFRCQFWGEPAAMWCARVVLNFQGKAERLSQRLTKSQPRALNRSNTSTKRVQPNPADHQRDRPRTSKINKNRYSHDRKMIRPSFFIIFYERSTRIPKILPS